MPVFLFIILVSISVAPVSADRGLIAPPQFSLEESGQIAIVAWNGKEEVLILSTNVKGSSSSPVVQVLPLPSNPSKVMEGDLDSFRIINELVNKRLAGTRAYGWRNVPDGGYGLEVTFHGKVGAHDMTIVEVSNSDHFVRWVADFAQGLGTEFSVSTGFRDIVSNYLRREIRYFLFDVVGANETAQTVKPMIYRFESSSLYYPLAITAASPLSETYSTLNLFLISKGQVNGTTISSLGLTPRSGFNRLIELSRQELMEISPELADLFDSDPLVMNVYYYGPLRNLKKDLVAPETEIHIPTPVQRLSQWLSDTVVFSYLSDNIQLLSQQTTYPNIIILVSFLVGVPTSIHTIAKPFRKVAGRATSRSGLQRLFGYGLAAALMFFVLFSGTDVVGVLGVMSVTLVGFAMIVFLLVRLMSKVRR